MPNWCYTTCTISGAGVDIERFKQACLYVDPKPDRDGGMDDGIDFQRIIPMPDKVGDNWCRENWGTGHPRVSNYFIEDGRHCT